MQHDPERLWNAFCAAFGASCQLDESLPVGHCPRCRSRTLSLQLMTESVACATTGCLQGEIARAAGMLSGVDRTVFYHVLSGPAQPGDDDGLLDGEAFEETQFPPLRYAVQAVAVRGYVNVLAGLKGHAKSTLASAMALSVASGKLFAGALSVERGPVVLIDLEDGGGVLQGRLRALAHGLGLPGIPRDLHVLREPSKDWRWPGTRERLEHAARRIKPVLAILDNLSRMHDGEETKEVVQPIMNDLADLSRAHDLASLLLHHETKSVEVRDRLAAVRGSTAITNTSRFVTTLSGRKQEDDALTVTAKFGGNYAADSVKKLRVRFGNTMTVEVVQDPPKDASSPRPGSKKSSSRDEQRSTREKEILKVLPGTTKDVEDKTAIPYSTVTEYLNRMKEEGRVDREEKRWMPVTEPVTDNESVTGDEPHGPEPVVTESRSRGPPL